MNVVSLDFQHKGADPWVVVQLIDVIYAAKPIEIEPQVGGIR
jgi:hypothetical protein